MKKYEIPQIRMMHFSDVIEVTSSGTPYVQEANMLAKTLRIDNEQLQLRMESINDLLTFSN
jgi:hypothetical protein